MASIKRIGKDKDGVPAWEAVYRRRPGAKQIRRRYHAATKAEVEQIVLLDSQRSDVDLLWSEGLRIYLDAKRAEGRNLVGLGHAERAVAIFIQLSGDMAIEETTPEILKDFMQRVAGGIEVRDAVGKTYTTAGPKVANQHRKELFTVARYLLRHTDKIAAIPFVNVPRLPVKKTRKAPIGVPDVAGYLNALPPFLRRPLQLVLFYGLRSSAICNLDLDSVRANTLVAIDKNNVERHIPIDDMLRTIIDDAITFRKDFDSPSSRLFVNAGGRFLERTRFLRSCQRVWHKAGLEKKTVHEFRHTLGTLGRKYFTAGMVQAAMGHLHPRSGETYFHPDEEMAAEVRQKIITVLSQNCDKEAKNTQSEPTITYTGNGHYTCPCCGSNLLISKKKGRKSK